MRERRKCGDPAARDCGGVRWENALGRRREGVGEGDGERAPVMTARLGRPILG